MLPKASYFDILAYLIFMQKPETVLLTRKNTFGTCQDFTKTIKGYK